MDEISDRLNSMKNQKIKFKVGRFSVDAGEMEIKYIYLKNSTPHG